jgi:FkbM family methyltransferase
LILKGGHLNFAHSVGKAMVSSMSTIITWPRLFAPAQALWIAVCLLLFKHAFFRSFKPQIRTTHGLQLAGSAVDSMLNRVVLYRGVFEPSLSDVIIQTLGPGDLAVDVGANVGYFTLLMAHQVGPTGQVITVEASPGSVGKLERNIAINGFQDRVKLIACACSDTAGHTQFFVNRLNDMHSRLQLPNAKQWDYWLTGSRGKERSWRRIEVPMQTLADILGAHAAQVRFIKLDIEGMETAVVPDLLRICTHPQLMVALEARAPDIGRTLDPFEQAGFHVYDLHKHYQSAHATNYADLKAKNYMVDVLLSRLPLP